MDSSGSQLRWRQEPSRTKWLTFTNASLYCHGHRSLAFGWLRLVSPGAMGSWGEDLDQSFITWTDTIEPVGHFWIFNRITCSFDDCTHGDWRMWSLASSTTNFWTFQARSDQCSPDAGKLRNMVLMGHLTTFFEGCFHSRPRLFANECTGLWRYSAPGEFLILSWR